MSPSESPAMPDKPPNDVISAELVAQPEPEAVISAHGAMRVLLVTLAVWTLFSGVVLVLFQESAAATIGGGLGGDEGEAAQRLLGVHLIALAAVYGLLAYQPKVYRHLLWLPYGAQAGVVAVTAFDIVTNRRDFSDGVLPFVIAAIFLVLLLYVWRSARRPEPPTPVEAEVVSEDERST